MRLSKIFIVFSILVLTILAIYIPLHLGVSDRIIEETKFYMGTIVQMKVAISHGADELQARGAIEKAFDEIARVERLFSTFKADSEISKINNLKPNEKLRISGETFWLIEKSILYNKKTEGVFDITIKPLVDLWAHARVTKTMPKDEDVRQALEKVGSQHVILDDVNSTILLSRSGMALDLGGVAKGYAADRAIKVLKENGIRNAIVNAGGDMYCLGRKSKEELWKVGVQHPRDRNESLLKVTLENKAIDTSGDYEKYFMLDNKRYSHIIDPRSGYPIGDNVISATVIAEDSTTSDILATALCILGHEGLNTVKTMKGVDAILIINKDGAFEIEMSEGMKERYEVTEAPYEK